MSLQRLCGRNKLLYLARKAIVGSCFLLHCIARFLRGKLDIPYFELVLTTRCTLRCEACNNMMQYFSSATHYTSSLEGIIESLKALFNAADSVQRIRVIGGEPLLFKDLDKVVLFLSSSPKVKAFDIVTNATIDFNKETLKALEGARNAGVTISDYRASPNLAVPLRQKSIIEALNEHKIPYHVTLEDGQGHWTDPGRVYKRGRPKDEVIRNFRACMMGCVSVMSSEGASGSSLAPLGAAFVCPIASSLSRLKGLEEFEGDFIDLSLADKKMIIAFYAKDYFKACDYCRDMWEEGRPIPPARQTKEVFSVERPNPLEA